MSAKGPKWVDVSSPEVEARDYQEVRYHSQIGRSTVTIRCPWCRANVVAYLWSLAGGGKRCNCGALFGSKGSSYHYKPTEQELEDG